MAEVEQKLHPMGHPTDGINVGIVDAGVVAKRHTHDARGNVGNDLRMPDRLILVLAEKPAHPSNAVSLDDVVRIDPPFQIRHIGDMSADDDGRLRLILPDQPTHPPHLEQIGNDRADPNDIVFPGLDLLDEPFLRGKVQKRTRGLQVHLDQHQPPGSIERAKREGVLDPRHLVVTKLHGVDHAAAILIVLSIGAEDAGQQHSRL